MLLPQPPNTVFRPTEHGWNMKLMRDQTTQFTDFDTKFTTF